MPEKNIEQILQDLYVIDSSLQKKESEIRQLITELIKTKPSASINEAFINELRTKLLINFNKKTDNKFNLINIFSMSKYAYALGGAAVFLLILTVVTLNKTGLTPQRLVNKNTQIAMTRLNEGAFGSINPNNNSAAAEHSQQTTGSLTRSAAVALPPIAANSSMADASGSTGPTKMIGTMLVAPTISYTYKYTGEPLNLTDQNADVYRRLKPGPMSGNWNDLLGQFIGGINLSSFNNLGLTSASFIQNIDKGYIINVNVQEGTLDISQNWDRWYPTICKDNKCVYPEMKPLTKEDMITDEEAIRIANDFLTSHGVDLKQYGTPAVEKNNLDFRVMSSAAKDSSNIMPVYYPDTVNVVLPLVLDNKKTVEANGQESGLRIVISIREKQVSSASQISANQYQVSAYPAETDADHIIQIAEKGGNQAPIYYLNKEATQEKVIQLGTPERVLLHTWNYQNNQQQELYVTALSFPIININELPTYYYQKAIIVPLAKEMLSDNNINTPVMSIPPAKPMMR
ncbi:MAG TPA: hypothetical protein VLK22_03310 [Candidatus Udaeobacter sp.]|nr:hypothetical protein [Candidatus Udaeobacter sp.]